MRMARTDQLIRCRRGCWQSQLQGGFPFQYGGLVRGTRSGDGGGGIFLSGAIQKHSFDVLKTKFMRRTMQKYNFFVGFIL
jgi:hypothetical protein